MRLSHRQDNRLILWSNSGDDKQNLGSNEVPPAYDPPPAHSYNPSQEVPMSAYPQPGYMNSHIYNAGYDQPQASTTIIYASNPTPSVSPYKLDI